MSNVPDLSLSIPCYNEEAGIRLTAESLASAFEAAGVDVELVLVDNGSTDRTGEFIDRMVADGLPVTKCVVARNRGYGFGALTGLNAARGRYVGIIPADGQVDPRDVVQLYRVLEGASAPILAKVRRRFRLDGLKRKVVSTIYNVIMNVLWGGIGSIDVNGTPKMFPRSYLTEMSLRSHDWFLDAEILIRAKQLGLRIVEMNALAQMRLEGASNVNAAAIGEFWKNILRWRLGRPPEPISADEATTVAGGHA